MGAQPELQACSVTEVLANMIGESHGAGGTDAATAWVALPATSAVAGQAMLPDSISMSVSTGMPHSMSMSMPMSMPFPPSDSFECASADGLSADILAVGDLATIFTSTALPCDFDDAVLGECKRTAFAEALLPSESTERSGADTLGSWHGAAGAPTASEAVSTAPSPVRSLQVRLGARVACLHVHNFERVAQMQRGTCDRSSEAYGQQPACTGLPRHLCLLLSGPPNAARGQVM